ncbi:SRPBCC family protein [Naasia lichenicola]|uniref:Transcriptional regulator n=1 Tax=Naasia lichenicola TaxID=2565933 RepID=A0A4S4FI96_9MICO|nr:SRPBCC family protein [Naasia lichenicola]THG30063.1 transcriptional regulator [Naasia lichenicola]
MAEQIVLLRSIDISAEPAEVAAAISDFHRWVEWSPFEGLDSNLARTYSGPQSGVGAAYAWEGNRQAGAGRMAVTSATDDEVGVKVNFLKPFKSESQSTFTMAPTAAGTHVAWQMSFEKTVLARVMSLVAPYEKVLGPELDKGLAKLKVVLEK